MDPISFPFPFSYPTIYSKSIKLQSILNSKAENTLSSSKKMFDQE